MGLSMDCSFEDLPGWSSDIDGVNKQVCMCLPSNQSGKNACLANTVDRYCIDRATRQMVAHAAFVCVRLYV